MQTWVPMLLGNTLIAGALAIAAIIVMRLRRPAIAHALWLLVLIKLVTPPVWDVAIPIPDWKTKAPVEVVQSTPVVDALPMPTRERAVPSPVGEGAGEGVIEKVAALIPDAPSPSPLPQERVTKLELPSTSVMLGMSWVTGTVLWLVVLAIRIFRFTRLTRITIAAPPEIQQRANMLARTLDLPASPPVELVPASISPMLWSDIRSTRLLVPEQLLETLDPEQRDALLLHELAHLKRKDHLTRWLEIVVTAIFWWHPLVWIARRGLREAEEQCCDAWVIWALPGVARQYADALVDTLDFLASSPVSLPPGASGLGGLHHLETRLTMIFTNTPPRAMSWIGRIMVLMLLGLLPLGMVWSQNPPAPPTTAPGLIRVRLVGSDGNPPAGAQAWIVTGDSPESLVYSPVKVDTEGRFNADGSSTPTFIVRAPNHGMIVRPFYANLDGTTISIRLHKPTRLRLTVVDQQGQPIANVPIGLGSGAMRLFHSPAMPADLRQHRVQTSDNQGICTFHDLNPETFFQFEVGDQRFALPDDSQAVRTGQQESCEAQLRLDPAARITGTIAFADSNKPVAGVRVIATPGGAPEHSPTLYAISDADGRFELNQLLGLRYSLSAELPEALRSDYALRGKHVTAIAGQDVQEQALSVVRSGTVRGRITSSLDGQALAGVSILAYERTVVARPETPAVPTVILNLRTATTKTAADGTFRLQLPPGQFDLLPGVVSRTARSVSISEGTAVEANFSLTRNPVPEGSITVRGHVRDPRGNPISGVIVKAAPLTTDGRYSQRGRSNDDGSFLIEGVNRDSELGLVSQIWTTLEGVKVEGKEGPFDLVAHENQFATARIVVLDEEGNPIPGASTQLVYRYGAYREANGWLKPTAADGSWTYRWQNPSHEVEAQARGTGYGTVTTQATLEPGKQTDIVLRLPKVEGANYNPPADRADPAPIVGRGRGGELIAPVPAREVVPPPSAEEQRAIEERLRARRLQVNPNQAP